MGRYDLLKEEAYHANMEIPRYGLAVYTFGNVSAASRQNGVFAIKPSGVSYDTLTPDSMVIVDFEGQKVEGDLNPSSDTKTHAVLYREFDTIGGVVHTHSTHAAAWAQAAKPIPCLGTTHADHAAGPIPCTAFMSDEAVKRDYEEETGRQILEVFRDLSYRETEMVLVAGHGPFTWGKDAAKAVYNSVVLEELARMAFITLTIESGTPTLKQSLIDKHYFRKHGKDAYYGQ
ncbi:MAG: L-ribulose-5-phosphate 4-epimerase AraD [Spirochaetia bacterium]